MDIRDRCSNIVFDTSIGNYKSLGWNSWCQCSFSRWECPRQYRKPGYSKVLLQMWLWEQVKSMHRENLGSTPGLHEHWCDFTVRQFLDEIRLLYVRPNTGRYVQHWMTYKWNSLCPPTLFLLSPLSVTATHHFQKLIPLHIFLSLEGKKEEGYFDRRKIC